jgi:hypothetical protein
VVALEGKAGRGRIEMTNRSRRFRRPNWDDADRIVRIVCKLADEAVKLILSLHGVR